MRAAAGHISGRKPCVAAILIAAAVLVAGCATDQAFRQGATAAREGNWDAAVEYYRRALQEAPDRAEYRIALERAMLNAAHYHAAAAELEALGDLPGALREYRRAYELDPSNEQAGVRIANLQQTLRERAEAARAPAPIEAMRTQARLDTRPALLDPVSDEPLGHRVRRHEPPRRPRLPRRGRRHQRPLRPRVRGRGGVGDAGRRDLRGGAVPDPRRERRVPQGDGPRTIIVVPETPEKRAEYEELVIRTFYVSHGDVEALAELLTALVSVPNMPVEPQLVANVAANAITVRATAPVAGIVERVLAANDKPRAEVVIDVEILEINRERAKRYGLDLSRYSISTAFSPEGAPAAGGEDDGASAASGLFNLDALSGGVGAGDFYFGVPTAVIDFIEQGTHTRRVAQPQIRGQEGAELELNLGQDIPVPTTPRSRRWRWAARRSTR